MLNMVGSIFFGISAIGAYVVPETERIVELRVVQRRDVLGCDLLSRRRMVGDPPTDEGRTADRGIGLARPCPLTR